MKKSIAVAMTIVCLALSGCASMGWRRGYNDCKKFHEGKDVYTWSYAYNYKCGWSFYDIQTKLDESLKRLEEKYGK